VTISSANGVSSKGGGGGGGKGDESFGSNGLTMFPKREKKEGRKVANHPQPPPDVGEGNWDLFSKGGKGGGKTERMEKRGGIDKGRAVSRTGRNLETYTLSRVLGTRRRN